jgi:hypothetical protein
MKVTEETALFTDALATMNRCIEENQSSTPYKQILAASEKLADGMTIGVAVYSKDPSTPHDFYTVRFENGRLDLVSHGKEEHDIGWKVSRDYLQKLAEHPDEYVKNPMKLDWDWLKSRLGVG